MPTNSISPAEMLRQTIAQGLKRSSVKTCSQWAESYRIMGKPVPGKWSFDWHPWLREMHDCTDEVVVGQKSAQMGFTEWALNTTFYAIDILAESVLYVLPSEGDASDFSASRFDPALEASPHLRNIFSDVGNVGHKRAGNANLFVRGSRSKSKLRSVPAGRMRFDEVDVMVQNNIPLALERMSGQISREVHYLSTPTLADYGINALFKDSSQKHFFFKCPHCSRSIELTPECLVVTAEDVNDPNIRDSHIICPKCLHRLEHRDKRSFLKNGVWVPTYTNRNSTGYYINQLYSCVLEPYNIAITKLKALSDPAQEQELYNSKYGLPHAVEGARVTLEIINECIGSFTMRDNGTNDKIVTMGVDVGTYLHVSIYEWSLSDKGTEGDISTRARPRLLKATKVREFEELDDIIKNFRVSACVVDANPERRKALELAERFPGIVKICFYGRGISGRIINMHSDEQHSLTVDRTSWLDIMFSRFHGKEIVLPMDVPLEFKDHIQSPVRIYKNDPDGNPVGSYVNVLPDHYAHSSNYAEIALSVAFNRSGYQGVTI